jgi:predicted Zn-dependent protease
MTMQALKEWDRAIHNWKYIEAIADPNETACDIKIKEVSYAKPKDNCVPSEKDSCKSNAVAWASTIGGREIFLTKGRYEDETFKVVMHEVGHALGAQHVNTTLMNPYTGIMTFGCPDRETVIQVAAWNHVDLRYFNWCY